MIMNTHLSAYTPSNMSEETLEKMFVQRQQLLKQSVASVEESLTNDKKNHLLFIGARGCGKTHLITMMINRLKKSPAIDDLIIVWLGEDDVVMNLTNFAVLIINKMASAYPQRFNNDCLDIAKGKSPDDITDIIFADIKRQVGDATLLVVKENMNEVFAGLKDLGQKRLRAYLQENSHISLLGTSQKLFEGVSSRNSAFFGFFDITHLQKLSVDEASQLISNIASIKQDQELVDFLNSSQGNYRIRALHYLAGGNHRLYVELASFLTKSSLDDFVEAITQLADHLTPYFQERIRALSTQQAGIIQKLCDLNGAIQVKVIAESLFLDERAVASQLKNLKDMGYVIVHKRGREAYYEIAEPLLRLSLEVKNNHGQPLKIIASLFRAWFSDDELRKNTTAESALLKAYSEQALDSDEILQDLRSVIWDELQREYKQGDHSKVIERASELLCVPNLNMNTQAVVLCQRILSYIQQRNCDGALADVEKVLAIKELSSEFLEIAVSLRQSATKLLNLSIFDDAVESYLSLDITKAGEALQCALANGNKAYDGYAYGTDVIVSRIALLDFAERKQEVEFLLKLYSEYGVTANLSSGVIQSIRYIFNQEDSLALFNEWAECWQLASKNYPEMQPAIDVLNATAQALTAGNDKPLFALPKELRELVLPMFEKKQSALTRC